MVFFLLRPLSLLVLPKGLNDGNKSVYFNFILQPFARHGGRERFWKKIYYTKPYLDTTTSKQVEYTKAFEITIIKELGKLTP